MSMSQNSSGDYGAAGESESSASESTATASTEANSCGLGESANIGDSGESASFSNYKSNPQTDIDTSNEFYSGTDESEANVSTFHEEARDDAETENLQSPSEFLSNSLKLEGETEVIVVHTPPASSENFEETLRSKEYQELDAFIRNPEVDPYGEEAHQRGLEATREYMSNGDLRRELALEWGPDFHKELQERDKNLFSKNEKTLHTSDGRLARPDGISLDSEGERDGKHLREIKTYFPDSKNKIETLKKQLEKYVDASTLEYGKPPESVQVELYEPGGTKDMKATYAAFLDAYSKIEQEKQIEPNTELESGEQESEKGG